MKHESIAIQLGSRQYLQNGPDEIGRTHIGYEPGLSDEQIYEAGRGLWSLNPNRLFGADYIFIVTNQGEVLIEVNLTGIQRVENGKYYITGDINKNSEYVGQYINVNTSRNRINYIETNNLL